MPDDVCSGWNWENASNMRKVTSLLLPLTLVAAACAEKKSSEDDYVDALMAEVENTGTFAKAENLEEHGFWVDGDRFWESAHDCTDLGLAVMTSNFLSALNRCTASDEITDTWPPE